MNLSLKKVLILCNDFPPINSIGADRPYSWYLYFKEFGLEPIVITKNWISDGNTPFNDVYNERKQENTELGTIIRSAKSNTPSIWFRDKLGTKFSIARKALTFIEKLFGFNFFSLDQHRSIYYEAQKYLSKNEVFAVITTGEPFILFRYGYLLKSEFNVKWIADYRDGWYLNHVRSLQKDPLNKLIRKIELKFEKRYTSKADFLTTVDPELADRIQTLTKVRTEVVYNGFWDFFDQVPMPLNKPMIVMNHTGTLTIGQRIEFLLDTLIQLKEGNKIDANYIRLNLIGLEYYPAQMARLEPYKKMLGKIINTTPRLSKKEAVKMNLEADYLINFTDPNISAIYAKTYDYIACMKPILVIPGDGKLLDNLIESNNIGKVFNSKVELRDFILQPLKFKEISHSNYFFKRQNQAKNLVSLITNEIYQKIEFE
jgi:hypothetical protein